MIGKAVLVGLVALVVGASPANAKLRQLSSKEIGAALGAKLASYSPPGWADAGVHEEYHIGGRWAGIRYGRGPVNFSGRWKAERNQLCVRAEAGLVGPHWDRSWVCRKVWIDTASGKLLMPHMNFGISPKPGWGALQLSVRPLPRKR